MPYIVVCTAGFTNMLIGLQKGAGAQAIQVVPLNDAPEVGVCKP